MDESVWAGAIDTARERLMARFSIADIDKYHSNMCELGQFLLTKEIHTEAQGLYDYSTSFVAQFL